MKMTNLGCVGERPACDVEICDRMYIYKSGVSSNLTISSNPLVVGSNPTTPAKHTLLIVSGKD